MTTPEWRYRPLPFWPYPETTERRSRAIFKAGYQDTLDRLTYEVAALDGTDLVIGAGWLEPELRLDGRPRAGVGDPRHPGVEVSFNTPTHGRLTYATDASEYWQHNVRNVALGLEALRAVDRYGISRRGEQYAGFAMIEAGETPAVRGERLVREAGSVTEALKRAHPDHGGDARDLQAVIAYRETLAGDSSVARR